MLVFASPVPAIFSGLGALQPRYAVEVASTEEQYFRVLAEEHERAAALARKRIEQVRRQQELGAQLRLQQQLAAAIQVRTPQRSPYNTPARPTCGRTLPSVSDAIFEFGTEDHEACDLYAERMHRRSQIAMLERQKRVEQQNLLCALFEEQRRTQAERIAKLHRKRAEEAKAEQERRLKAQKEAEQEQARRHLAARAADEERLRQFFQSLAAAMSAAPEPQGADLERKNAIRRSSLPPQEKPEEQILAPTPASPKPAAPERPVSPAPSVASNASDVSLHSISLLQDKYNSLRSSFQFPSNLGFAPTASPVTPASAPTLLYTSTNAPVHGYENSLTSLLTELDAVESFGDEHIRDVRRSLVRSVEAELEALEEKKRQAWRDQQEGQVAPAPAESTSVPISVETPAVEPESTPVRVESAPAPATSSTESPNSVTWIADRLAQPFEIEDDEVKAVRENVLASLTTLSQASETESPKELFDPEVMKSSQPEPEASEPVVESTVDSVSEPEVVEVHTSPVATESELEQVVGLAESAPVPATEPEVVPTPVAEPEAIFVSTSATELATIPVSTVESASPSPVEFVAESGIVFANSSEPEVVVKDEILAHAQSEPGSSQSEPEPESTPSLAQLQEQSAHEQSTFVQVFPDSGSDIDTDADLASELADMDKKSGDEFELV